MAQPVTESNFDEEAYLRANPDVRAAVLNGDFESGRQHWDRHGHAESRVLFEDETAGELQVGRFCKAKPRLENAASIFGNEWVTALPGIESGAVDLFNDPVLHWFGALMGGYSGKSILELGPMEAANTAMMDRDGGHVLAIEANVRSYLKCLVVKELYSLGRSRFHLGDFTQIEANTGDRYDFILAKGVLYHLMDPVSLLVKLTSLTNRIGIWTHYFDPEVFEGSAVLQAKGRSQGIVQTTAKGREIHLFGQEYLSEAAHANFCGGLAPGSLWMRRDDILGILQDEGFDCHIEYDSRFHQNGPSFAIYAERSVAAA